MNLMPALLAAWFAWTGAGSQPPYDLLLHGGHVIDARNGIDGLRDVAISQGKIARVAADIPQTQARRRIRLDGLYVVPGLVDLHVHVYAGTGVRAVYAGDLSLYPDAHTFRSGVTTAVDAGTAGWRNFPDFKERIIDRARTRVLAWINVVGVGMSDRAAQQRHEDMDPKATADVIRRFPEVIVGVKTAHYDGPDWTAVDRALEAGKLSDRPVMVDFGAFRKERPFQELVRQRLRPGDVYTHLYHGPVPLLDERGELQSYLAQARQRGVRFDVGHGADAFWWSQAVPAVRQGFVPDTISTDLHYRSANAGMKDMTNVMSKFLNLGVELRDVVRMSTATPAEVIRRPELGNLSEGAPADVAVLRLRTGEFGFLDSKNFRLAGDKRLECELTLRDGQVVWDLNGRAGEELRGKSVPD